MIHFWIGRIQIIITQIFFMKHIRIIIHVIRVIIFILIFHFLFLVVLLVSLMIRVFNLQLLLLLYYIPGIILLVILDVVIIEIFLRLFDNIITPFYYTSILDKFTHCLSLVDLTLNLPAFILLTNRQNWSIFFI